MLSEDGPGEGREGELESARPVPGFPGAHRIRVATSSGAAYPVEVGPGLLRRLPELLEEYAPAHRYALIGDKQVMRFHGERVGGVLREADLQVDAVEFPEGEEHKTRTEWARLTDTLLRLGLGRDGCVLALGGGVTGDLAGFVAATYMRGIPVVQLPTSLVAMVDSSVGGKTGVDVPSGKNLVGAFHPPRLVLADTDLTRTLPRAERSQGLVEAIKHGAIADPTYLTRIQELAPRLLEGDDGPTAEVVTRSVEIKGRVVGRDEKEGGLRQVLNFGHTLGHALEAASGYRLPHGSAVAVGMVLEARLGERLGITRTGTARQLEAAVRALEVPASPPSGLPLDQALDLLERDKKARKGEVRFVLLDEPGQVHRGKAGSEAWSHPAPAGLIRQVLESSFASGD